MKDNTVKKLCLLCLCAVLLLSACTGANEAPPALPAPSALPEAERTGEAAAVPYEAELYFVSADGRQLTTEKRTLLMAPGVSHAAAAVEALLAGPTTASLQRAVQEGLQLEKVELSADVCNVYLRGNVSLQVRPWLTARAAIAATVNAAEGSGSVNVYYNGVEPGYYNRPFGVCTPVSEALDAYIKNLEQEYEILAQESQTEAGSYETRTATLYFADIADTLLLSRNTTINYDRRSSLAQIAQLLISKLREGDAGENALEPVLPADFTLLGDPLILYPDLAVQPESAQTEPTPAPEDGAQAPVEPQTAFPDINDSKRIVELSIARPEYDYDETLMCGALTLTLTGYLPQIHGVRILMQQPDGEMRNLCTEGYFTRAMFEDRIGYTVYLVYPDAEGASFCRVSRAIASADACDAQIRLQALFAGPADPGVMLPGFSAADIQRVYIVGDTAVVNWAPGFTDKLEALVEEGEAAFPTSRRAWFFAYSVINTLTELPGVQRVWMLENGEKLGTVDGVYLGNALMRNPGIVLEN